MGLGEGWWYVWQAAGMGPNVAAFSMGWQLGAGGDEMTEEQHDMGMTTCLALRLPATRRQH